MICEAKHKSEILDRTTARIGPHSQLRFEEPEAAVYLNYFWIIFFALTAFGLKSNSATPIANKATILPNTFTIMLVPLFALCNSLPDGNQSGAINFEFRLLDAVWLVASGDVVVAAKLVSFAASAKPSTQAIKIANTIR